MASTNSRRRCPPRSRQVSLIVLTYSSLLTCVVGTSPQSSWTRQPLKYHSHDGVVPSQGTAAAFAHRKLSLLDLRHDNISNSPVCFPTQISPSKRTYSPWILLSCSPTKSVDDSSSSLHADAPSSFSSTSSAGVTPSKFLSEDTRHEIETLVSRRSEARWNGDYRTADEIRRSIDEIRMVLPWSAVASAHPELQRNEYWWESSEPPPLEGKDVDDWNFDLEYRVLVTDLPRSQGGGSTWELISTKDTIETFFSSNGINGSSSNDSSGDKPKEDNVLQLAHAALGMAVSSSERGRDVHEAELQRLVQRARHRLNTIRRRRILKGLFPGIAGAGELHGRKAADAVLWFALAGVVDDDDKDDRGTSSSSLYDGLVEIATEELLRFGNNASCRAKDILHIVERVAMAGIVGAASRELYAVAADCLEAKISTGMSPNHDDDQTPHNRQRDDDDDNDNNNHDIDSGIDYPTIIQSLRDSSFGLHSDRPLLGLWRFSTRQRKQRAFFQNAARHYDHQYPGDGKGSSMENTADEGHGLVSENEKNRQYDWSSRFRDPSRPLVVDVGCGMGVSLLGLAKKHAGDGNNTTYPSPTSDIPIHWKECNFLGVDLSRLAIRYARGVSERWGLGHCLNFVVDPAEECLTNIIHSYPGEVRLVMVQFPTPFRFQNANDDDDGYDDDETGKESVVQRGYNAQLPTDAKAGFMVTESLLSQIHKVISKSNGMLLLQSNCEDVAVHMRNTAIEKCGFHSRDASHPVVTSSDASSANMPKRALDYINMGGERAMGSGWSARPLLPHGGRTETEVACMLDEKPVHRCLLTTERDY